MRRRPTIEIVGAPAERLQLVARVDAQLVGGLPRGAKVEEDNVGRCPFVEVLVLAPQHEGVDLDAAPLRHEHRQDVVEVWQPRADRVRRAFDAARRRAAKKIVAIKRDRPTECDRDRRAWRARCQRERRRECRSEWRSANTTRARRWRDRRARRPPAHSGRSRSGRRPATTLLRSACRRSQSTDRSAARRPRGRRCARRRCARRWWWTKRTAEPRLQWPSPARS